MRFGAFTRQFAPALLLLAQSGWSASLPRLEFANRAACAQDSRKPSRGALVIVDGYNAGKLAHSIAKTREGAGGNAQSESEEGMRRFRVTLGNLLKWASEEVMRGRFPLLPENVLGAGVPAQLRQIVERSCPVGGYCAELDPTISAIRARKIPAGLSALPAQAVGQATAQAQDQVGCFVLRDVSRLQSQLFADRPDQKLLQGIALDASREALLREPCGSVKSDLPFRNFMIELDLGGGSVPDAQAEALWNVRGFDVWNTIRILVSWGWRNLDLKVFGAAEYSEAFANLDLEDMVLFAANGCASLSSPACDQAQLTLGALRDFATSSGRDSARVLPRGADDALIRDPKPVVNSDILRLNEGKSLEEWAAGFNKRMNANGLELRLRVNEAMNRLSILQQNLPAARILSDIRARVSAQSRKPELLNSAYVLCSEFQYASGKSWGALEARLQRLSQLRLMRETSLPWSEEQVRTAQVYETEISRGVIELCDGLQKTAFFEDFTGPARGHSAWFRELLNDSRLEPENQPAPASAVDGSIALLRFCSPLKPEGEVICADGLECARAALSSMVDLIAAFDYAESLLSIRRAAPEAPLFNPYAERTACRSYDPGFKTRKAVVDFLADLANTALFGWNPLPVFFNVELKAGEVHSFKKLVESGKVRFDPQFVASKPGFNIGLDASLLGVPCALAFGTGMQGFRLETPYFFEGVSLSACRSKEGNQLEFESPDSSKATRKSVSGCAACTLNFSSAAKSLVGAGLISAGGPGFNPIKLGVYLINSFARLRKELSDRDDVPRRWTVDPDQVLAAYRKHAKIPEKCVDELTSGRSCEARTCESMIAEDIESALGGRAYPIRTSQVKGRDFVAEFTSSSCQGSFELQFDRSPTRECGFFLKPIVQRARATRGCLKQLPRLRKEFLL